MARSEDSDDEIVELTRQHTVNALAAQSSARRRKNEARRRLGTQAEDLDLEIDDIKEQIETLQKRLESRQQQRQIVEEEVANLDRNRAEPSQAVVGAIHDGIDYSARSSWFPQLQAKMKEVFNIAEFRLCQEGVVNACMDQRDVVCVMPTGGGKSLTYQLPALITPGCTIVVSPLISLMTDQILHLQEAGVRCLMLSGSTSYGELRRLDDEDEDIKLAYVTPEKIGQSGSFLATLQSLYERNRLSRFVIDEAHCVSQLGHDYREYYRKLSVLRERFPKIPIMAVSATCPPAVLRDLTKVLGLRKVTDGLRANFRGTVYFSSPLYRKNLYYRVIPKPSSKYAMVDMLQVWIQAHHTDHSGIIYCLSKSESEEVAEGLQIMSKGKIKTGVYHAEIDEDKKHALHVQWREGTINVVCATIAFGLGIDKGDVRFVIHHSIPKSIDGFYQESGRAGRDGKPADCILYYRPQDETRLSSMVYDTKEGKDKLYAMLQFSQNMRECRKVAFAKYFSITSDIELSSWTTADADALSRCGHCDNCQQRPESFETCDMTFEAWQILKIAKEVQGKDGKQTLKQLAELVRGTWSKVKLDLDALIGGKLKIGRERCERLLIELLLRGFLTEVHVASRHHTSHYRVHTYVTVANEASCLTELSRNQIEDRIKNRTAPVSLDCTFSVKAKKVPEKAKARKPHRKPTRTALPLTSADMQDSDDSSSSSESDSDPNLNVDRKWSGRLRPALKHTAPTSAASTKLTPKGKTKVEHEIIVIQDSEDVDMDSRPDSEYEPDWDSEAGGDDRDGTNDDLDTRRARKRPRLAREDSEDSSCGSD